MKELVFPGAILDQHLVVLGKTGAGKSSALRHIVEHLLRHKKRVCVIDPKGDWNGLKVSADGNGPGFPVILFGNFKETAGQPIPADVPLNEYSGKHIAELVTSGNRPCVVGFRGWTMGNMHRFWIDFAATIFNSNEGELYLVIDEVHNFAPKGKIMSPEVGMCLHWSNRIMNEGRGIGLVNLIASQRPQKVHNDTLTACETLVAMRVIHKADRDAVEDWVKGCGDDKQGKEVLNSLAGMKRGEAFVWSPEADFGPERLTFPMFQTFDSFAPPQLQKKVSGKDWASVDLDVVKQKLAAVIEKAKAEDPRELNKIISELRKEIIGLKKTAGPREQDTKRIQELTEQLQAEKAREKPVGKAEVKEKKIVMAGDLSRLESFGLKLDAHNEASKDIVSTISGLLHKLKLTVSEAKELNAQQLQVAAPAQDLKVFEPGFSKPSASVIRPRETTGARSAASGNGSLPEGEQKILAALIQYSDGLERSQIGILTGYSKRSTRDAYIARLATKGFADNKSGKVFATTEGIAALPDAQPLPTGFELQQYWLARLPEGERKILDYLLNAFPNAVAREKIGEDTGYDKRSTRDAYIARLSLKQLVNSSGGGVKASDVLFD